MKPRMKVVSVVAVVVTLLVLPYLFSYYIPSEDQILCGISSCVVESVPKQNPAPFVAVDDATSTVLGARPNVSVVSSEAVKESGSDDDALRAILARAATQDKTVIITTLNQAWAARDTMIDVFLESFQKGENTKFLLNHLVIIALDQRSMDRCQELHSHCFMLKTDGVDFSGNKGFMSKDYLKMMWRRMNLLRIILEMGFNFVFTDADILWFRNPFEVFAKNADFQISCDRNRGGPFSLKNKPNCGYQYARSNERTIAMYRHWCKGGDKNPDMDDQSQFNVMLQNQEMAAYKVKMRFLPTQYFSGLCQKSANLSRVVTMHANCCTGLDNKVKDLRQALRVWEGRASMAPTTNASELWPVPKACKGSIFPSPPPHQFANLAPPLRQTLNPSQSFAGSKRN